VIARAHQILRRYMSEAVRGQPFGERRIDAVVAHPNERVEGSESVPETRH
jgi:hypothetical protein